MYKCKWMVLVVLVCVNIANIEKQLVNHNIVLDVLIICQKLRHVQIILKKYCTRTYS